MTAALMFSNCVYGNTNCSTVSDVFLSSAGKLFHADGLCSS